MAAGRGRLFLLGVFGLLDLLPLFEGHDDLAGLGAFVCPDDAGCGHLVDQA